MKLPENKYRLPTPELHVFMRDGAEFTVQAYSVDLVAWDQQRARQKWPLPSDAPFLWMQFLAWHALTKTQKLLPACTLNEFGDLVAAVTSTNPDEQADDEVGVDPTNRDLEDV